MRRDSRLRAIAEETMAIVSRGGYGGVQIGRQVGRAVAGTVHHLPGDRLPLPAVLDPAAASASALSGEALSGAALSGEALSGAALVSAPGLAAVPGGAIVEVTGETTLAAARRLGGDVACLNFASARSPGGGFLNGAEAQEEFLARSSALYPCLLAAGDFYAHHRAHPDPAYTDRIIYSPAVPVFRDDDGGLLDEAYEVSFLTCAAPNTAVLDPSRRPEVPALLEQRAARILAVAAAHGHRRLVLGAWGCGVFGNDPAVVAEAFAAVLRAAPWFDEVVFAILERDRGAPIRAAFTEALLGEPA